MEPTVRALLFDLDGTLIDHDAAASLALAETLATTPDVPSDLNREHAARRWTELERHAMDRYAAGELTFPGQRRLRIVSLAAELGLGAWDDTRADVWFATYLRHYEAAWRLFPDVRPMLDTLIERQPHVRLGVLTNGDSEQQRHKLRAVGLAADLPHVIISSEVGAAKPSPVIFERAADLLGLPPGRIAYVGDRLRTDALAATKAGMHGIWLTRHGEPAPPPVSVIQTLHDVPALLTSLGEREPGTETA
ncbi:HAD family hydrolase [Sphaerisporangium album]|uniref:HAD family hydrolase n=1 Tax=Sphaerisporangium album TaxID=509200 RepID=A0A367FH07_9ACTN|nr:HAD family hydrolase [Sphaerisporangium album]RCG28987.1 HAD family hydrolase [Sphaerisporangium album]